MRIKQIACPQFQEQDTELMKHVLQQNGYPKSFIEEHFKPSLRSQDNETESEDRKILLKLKFKGDAAAELFRRKVERSLARNCQNVLPVLVFTTQKLISTNSKEKTSIMATSNVIYRFTCTTCKLQYVGQTYRRLADRVKDHIPRWVVMHADKTARTKITEHIVNEGHVCDKDSCFEIIYHAKEQSNPQVY